MQAACQSPPSWWRTSSPGPGPIACWRWTCTPPRLQGFFDVPVDHLYAAPVLNEYFNHQGYKREELVVVSADEGSIKRALGHAKRLGGRWPWSISAAPAPKPRGKKTSSARRSKDKIVLMFDDMISTASSICGAARVLKANGAKQIHVAATHGVLVGPAIERLSAAPIDTVIITDTIPLRPQQTLPKIRVLSVAALLGQAIKRIHRNESVSMLFG